MVVNKQISFECIYGTASVPGKRPESSTLTLERMTSQPGSTIKPAALRGFPLFADFSDRELRQLLRLMRRWDLPPRICGGERRWARGQLLHHRQRQR